MNYAANIHGQAGSVDLNLAPLKRTKKVVADCARGRVRVGILEHTNDRDDGETNADVGYKMEFGVSGSPTTWATPGQMRARNRGDFEFHGAPARSFLRAPLMLHLKGPVLQQGPLLWRKLIEGGGVKAALEWLGFMAEGVIHEAFDSAGFGQWKANSARYILWKGSNRPLIDSHQLQNSITSEVVI